MITISIGEIKPLIYQGYKTNNFISDTGIVYNKNMQPKKLHKVKGGYLRANITINGKEKHVLVHRLVVENFIGEIPDGMEVDHINGDKEDNSVCNLEIVTPKENIKRAVKNELILQGEQRSGTKYSEKVVKKICEYLEKESNKNKIAKKLNVPAGLVRSIACGAKWKYISKNYNILPTKSSHKFTAEEVEKILKLYKKGKTYKQIANKLDIKINSVISCLQKYATNKNHPHHKYTKKEDKLILKMKKDGFKNKEIADIIGVTKSAIASRYKRIKNEA